MVAILVTVAILSGLLGLREICRGWETSRYLARAFLWGAILGAAGGLLEGEALLAVGYALAVGFFVTLDT